MMSRLEVRERWPLAFEDIISDTDFLSDEAYVLYASGTPDRKFSLTKAQTSGWREAEEVSRIFALAAIVATFAGLSWLVGVLRL